MKKMMMTPLQMKWERITGTMMMRTTITILIMDWKKLTLKC